MDDANTNNNVMRDKKMKQTIETIFEEEQTELLRDIYSATDIYGGNNDWRLRDMFYIMRAVQMLRDCREQIVKKGYLFNWSFCNCSEVEKATLERKDTQYILTEILDYIYKIQNKIILINEI